MKKQDYLDLADYLVSGRFDRENPKSIFYRGFGQLGALLLDPETPELWPAYQRKLHPLVQQIHELTRKKYNGNSAKVLSQLKDAALSSYFTPSEVIEAITKSLNFGTIKHVLDPSAGTGNFLSYLPVSTRVTALEPDQISYEVLQQLYPSAELQNCAFEEARLASYDLIISNIPFGSHRVFDQNFLDSRDAVKIASTTRVHNYFFLKAADHLTKNGLIAFITSSGFSDSPSNENIRKHLVESCLFRAGVRLPGEVFSDAGTKPTTDLLIFQKRNGQALTAEDKLFIESSQKLTAKGPLNLNCYFKVNPRFMIGEPVFKGQHSNVQYALSTDQTLPEIAAELGDLITRQLNVPVPEATAQATPDSEDPESAPKLRIKEDQVNHRFEPGNFIIHKNKVHILQKDHLGFHLLPARDVKSPEQVRRLIQLRLTYFDLIEAEQENLKDIESLRTKLNTEYDTYHFQFGQLNATPTRKLLEQDISAHALFGLEVEKNGAFDKADIFHKRIHNIEQEEVKVQSLSDAIVVSLNRYNRIHLGYLAETLGKAQSDVIRQAIEEDLLYLDYVDGSWRMVTKDQFLSGDVYAKLDHIEASFPEKFNDLKSLHQSMIAEIVPTVVPFKLLDINLGETWIDSNLYNQFLTDFFQVDSHVIFLKSSDKYEVVTDYSSTVSKIDFAVHGKDTLMTGKELMQHAFSDTSPMITYPVKTGSDKTVRLADIQAIRSAQDKIELIKQRFQQWVEDHAEWQVYLEKEYNRLFNYSVPRVYDGAHLKFESLQIFKPYLTQKNAIYRNLQQNGGINDHIVGAGKTLVMAISAYEMKRLGIAKKPLIIAKNANVGDIYKEFKKAYPFSRVLHPTERDFQPKRRRLMFSKMMNNHWDAVIISHDQFKMIPQSLHIQREILQSEMDALDADLNAVTKDEGRSASQRELKGLRIRKKNLATRLAVVKAKIKRDTQIIDFENMGFDHLFVDESQEFKNLMYTTRHRHISGLGNPKGSQRAYNLLIACRTIQRKLGDVDKGITFLSGTTISNSLVELYLLFKYLRPHALKRLKINSFDSWAKVYARKTYDFEFGITNEIKRKERYRQFIKVPQLAQFYTEITDVVNHKNFKQDKPEVVNQIISLPPTKDQVDYMKKLVAFARTQNGDLIGYYNMTRKEKNAYMLIATTLAKKMSLDMRLIAPEYGFAEGCKLDVASKNIAEIYHRTTEHKGTQLVFCDMSTPSKEWNVYNALKDLLVQRYGVKPEEIAFIHETSTVVQRFELFKKVRAGIIRILVGSTHKMGVGVNVQDRVFAMHHFDIPWRPSDMTQRTGRGGRPGNIMAKLHNNNVVDNFIYATEKSLDAYQFNLLANKQRFIDQIKDNSIQVRTIDEGAMDSEGSDQTMNFAEYVAILSGNQTLLQKVKVDKELKDLQLQYEAFEAEKRYAQRAIQFADWHLSNADKEIAIISEDINSRDQFEASPDPIVKKEDRYYYPKPIVYQGQKYYDSKDIGIRLLELFSEGDPIIFAKYGPFQVKDKDRQLVIQGSGHVTYSSGHGRPAGLASVAGQYIKRALRSMESKLEDARTDKERHLANKKAYEQKANMAFPKLDRMGALKEESKRLEREIEDAAMEESNEQTQEAA